MLPILVLLASAPLLAQEKQHDALVVMRNEIINQKTVDTALFYRFADNCIANDETDLLVTTYTQLLEKGQKDFMQADLPMLYCLTKKVNAKPLNETSFYTSYYLGKMIVRFHLDSASALQYFSDAVRIAKKLDNTCLLCKAYFGMTAYYMNIKHDVIKTNEYCELIEEALKKDKLNGIRDCNVDVNVVYSVLYYYLEDFQKCIYYLSRSIGTVKTLNKPQRLFDLYMRRAAYEILVEQYDVALATIDSARQAIVNEPNKEQLQIFINADSFNVYARRGDYAKAVILAKNIDAERLHGGNDEYYEYLLNLIKLNIHLGNYEQAQIDLKLYTSSLKSWNLQRWRNVYELKYLMAKDQNNLGDALKYYEQYTIYNDSVHHQRQNYAVLSQQIKYHTHDKEEALMLQVAVNKEQHRTIEFVISVLVTVCLLSVTFFVYRNNKTLREKNKLSKLFSQKLIDNTELTQNRLAHELHDGLGQELLLLKNNLTQQSDRDNASKVADIIENVRVMARELYPALLNVIGLKSAMENQLHKIDQSEQIFVSAKVNYNGRLDKHTELQVFRIFQEAITNVLKYANATSVFVGMEEKAGTVTLTIKDNGRGFDVAEKLSNPDSFGLWSMQRRAESINGILKITSTGKETEITLTFQQNENISS